MQIFHFGPANGQAISMHQSEGFVLARWLRLEATAVLSAVYLEAGGVIGYHPAIGEQVLLVLTGAGTVRGG